MNILVPVTWLGEYLKTSLPPEEVARLGSLHGTSFERLEKIAGEDVYDIEITTNRVDEMSIKGLARELAAILGDQAQALQMGAVSETKLPMTAAHQLPLPVHLQSEPSMRYC